MATKVNTENTVQFVDDGWWDADDVQFNYKGKQGVAKVHLCDDDGNEGTYLARIRNGEVLPDPNADKFDPAEPERINIDPSSDVFERMVRYMRHKAIF